MPKLDAKRAIDLLESIGEEPRAYSGRKMYGKQCVAVVPEERDAFSLGFDLANVAHEETNDPAFLDAVAETFRYVKTDSMGHGIVIYWPRIEWPADRAE